MALPICTIPKTGVQPRKKQSWLHWPAPTSSRTMPRFFRIASRRSPVRRSEFRPHNSAFFGTALNQRNARIGLSRADSLVPNFDNHRAHLREPSPATEVGELDPNEMVRKELERKPDGILLKNTSWRAENRRKQLCYLPARA
jgi:hypothetical protein